jgi:hypothetical protein
MDGTTEERSPAFCAFGPPPGHGPYAPSTSVSLSWDAGIIETTADFGAATVTIRRKLAKDAGR